MITCKECKFFRTTEQDVENKVGRCCYKPPVVMVLPVQTSKIAHGVQQQGLALNSVWPSVFFDEGCSKGEKEGPKNEIA